MCYIRTCVTSEHVLHLNMCYIRTVCYIKTCINTHFTSQRHNCFGFITTSTDKIINLSKTSTHSQNMCYIRVCVTSKHVLHRNMCYIRTCVTSQHVLTILECITALQSALMKSASVMHLKIAN